MQRIFLATLAVLCASPINAQNITPQLAKEMGNTDGQVRCFWAENNVQIRTQNDLDVFIFSVTPPERREIQNRVLTSQFSGDYTRAYLAAIKKMPKCEYYLEKIRFN